MSQKPGPQFRILMVDDISRYHRLYELAITDALPSQVSFAVNGEEALKKLASPIPYDLLILDLNMPKLGGEETLRRIRQDANFDNMPVIILTGDTDQDTHRRLLDIGADDFVEKGAPPEVFVARLKAQMRFKLALDRLTRVAVDMDIFAAGVLHDIRNLETTITTLCQLTQYYLDDDPLKHRGQILADFTSLEERAESLEHYAAEIISMVRETHQPLTIKAEPVRPLIEWAVKMSQPDQSIAQDEAAGLTVDFVGDLMPVAADRHFLQLALLNIIQNAVKYRQPGTPAHVIVTQYVHRGIESKGDLQAPRCVLRLRDHGVGIRKTDLRKVFEPFVRGSDRTQKDGYGLGLSLVAKVMSSMGGRVWAELPKEGAGTVMCLELPLAEAPK